MKSYCTDAILVFDRNRALNQGKPRFLSHRFRSIPGNMVRSDLAGSRSNLQSIARLRAAPRGHCGAVEATRSLVIGTERPAGLRSSFSILSTRTIQVEERWREFPGITSQHERGQIARAIDTQPPLEVERDNTHQPMEVSR